MFNYLILLILTSYNIIIDPGRGFSKNKENNIDLIKNIKSIKNELKYPLLLGASKKRFMSPYNQSSTVNSFISGLGMVNGADIIRLHNPEEQRDIIESLNLNKKYF